MTHFPDPSSNAAALLLIMLGAVLVTNALLVLAPYLFRRHVRRNAATRTEI